MFFAKAKTQDHTKISSLEHVSELLSKETLQHSLALLKMRYKPRTLKKLEKFLEEKGIYQIPYDARWGRVALVFDIGGEQTVRISPYGSEPKRPKVPEILQPLLEESLEKLYTISVFPKLHVDLAFKVLAHEGDSIGDYVTNRRTSAGKNTIIELVPLNIRGVSVAHVHTLVKRLWDEHQLLFWDAKPENVGLLFDNTPVVIDSGAVVPISKANETVHLGNNSYIQRFNSIINQNLPLGTQDTNSDSLLSKVISGKLLSLDPLGWDGSWEGKLARHNRHFNLIDGEVQGAFPSDYFEKLYRGTKGISDYPRTFQRLVMKYRLNSEEVESCASKAINRVDGNESADFFNAFALCAEECVKARERTMKRISSRRSAFIASDNRYDLLLNQRAWES